MSGSFWKIRRTLIQRLLLVSMGCVMAGCTDFLANSGPSRGDIDDISENVTVPAGIQVIDVNDAVTRQLLKHKQQQSFAEFFPYTSQNDYQVGHGDTLEVSIWEAPPATLFTNSTLDPRNGTNSARTTTFPEQMINEDGYISMPFVGSIRAAGLSLRQIETEIRRGLEGKANLPQVLVRVTRNATSNVTVVGEVTHSALVPLTPRRERLLDALAMTGGVRQPTNKISLQVTRGNTVGTMPLDNIIRDPAQNITLQPGDVITALFQPFSFTALGATNKNEEINFEAQGISLTQALARVGGLLDYRADAMGVFLFRWEEPDALNWPTKPRHAPDGRVPVIYKVDLKNPASFLLSQSFAIKDKDLLYIANAPSAEIQKFLMLITSFAYPAMMGANFAKF